MSVERPHPVRVAVDGPDAAGKTTLADELASAVGNLGRPVIRASIDSFHQPREIRYRREDSPEGCYHDTFDYDALRKELLEPLGPDGDRTYCQAIFDYQTDQALARTHDRAPDNAILLLDGVFLLRPELIDIWDLRIYVSVTPEETLRRALERDAVLFGSREEVERRYRSRYLPAQQLYHADARPLDNADIVVDNDDPARPAAARLSQSERS